MMKYGIQRFYISVFYCNHVQKVLYSSQLTLNDKQNHLVKHVGTNHATAEYLCIKYPVVSRIKLKELISLTDTLTNLGIEKTDLIKVPVLFSVLPITLQLRFRVLQECGFRDITGYEVAYFRKLIRNMSIEEVLKSGYIIPTTNIPNRLASYMSQWPTSLTTSIESNINGLTLHTLRLTILKKYLELVLNLSDNEFNRVLKTYPTIKHRPLQMIHESMEYLLKVIKMPVNKLKSNPFLIHVNSENLKEIVNNVKDIGGIDVKEVMRMYPKICSTKPLNLEEIKNIMKEFGIDKEAQIRCFTLFTLAPNTVRDRLQKAKETPEFRVYLNHPRFLKIILFNKLAMKRLLDMYKTDKKCLTLNSLSGSTKHFQEFAKATGDRCGKGKDMIYFISEEFKSSINDVSRNIKRHPYWINIPLVHVKMVQEQLLRRFSPKDIFQNCPILLYPTSKINFVLNIVKHKNDCELHKLMPHLEQINLDKLNKSQVLSLTLYILEKHHNFSGNGVWIDNKLT